MTVFICLDDNNGMLFHRRRQSRDKAVTEDMLQLAGQEKIWMNACSAKLFEGAADRIMVAENFLEIMQEGGCCFLENIPLKPYEDKIKIITVYYWNREYPADTYLDMDLEENWEVVERRDFGGNSHEEITRKIYRRKDC